MAINDKEIIRLKKEYREYTARYINNLNIKKEFSVDLCEILYRMIEIQQNEIKNLTEKIRKLSLFPL